MFILRCFLPCLVLGLWSCRSEEPATASINPGINDAFLQAESAEPWVTRFEGDGREIAAHRDAIVAAVGLRAGDDVADVGAGTGLFLQPFAEAVGDSGRVYAVDLAPVMVAQLAQRKRALGLTQVQVVQCSERSTELPADTVDLVFVSDTYHHFEYPMDTLGSIHRALRADGELVVIDFHRIEGVSSEWTLNHLRAGEDVFTAEIEKAGFELVERRDDLMEQNYFLRFRKIGS